VQRTHKINIFKAAIKPSKAAKWRDARAGNIENQSESNHRCESEDQRAIIGAKVRIREQS